MTRRPLSRRTLLRNGAVALGLPFLEAMLPSTLSAGEPAAAAAGAAKARRLVCCYVGNGVVNENWYPKKMGKGYDLTPTLQPLQGIQDQVNVIDGLWHALVPRQHACNDGWLTGAPFHKGQQGESLDQVVARHYGRETRYPSLQIGPGNKRLLSHDANGVGLPGISKTSDVYRRLFRPDTEATRESRRRGFRADRSVLDAVNEQSKDLQKQLGRHDRDKLDQYFTAVREVEQLIGQREHFIDTPKPEVDRSVLTNELRGKAEDIRVMYDLVHLALETDSTRIVTWNISPETSGLSFKELGINGSHHPLSHHGGDADTIAELAKIDAFLLQEQARFLKKLQESKDPTGTSLLDRTLVLYGSGLNNGIGYTNGTGQHGNKKLATLLAGGKDLGIKQGQHVRYEGDPPMANLHLTMLQALGLEADRFSDSTGTLGELA